MEEILVQLVENHTIVQNDYDQYNKKISMYLKDYDAEVNFRIRKRCIAFKNMMERVENCFQNLIRHAGKNNLDKNVYKLLSEKKPALGRKLGKEQVSAILEASASTKPRYNLRERGPRKMPSIQVSRTIEGSSTFNLDKSTAPTLSVVKKALDIIEGYELPNVKSNNAKKKHIVGLKKILFPR